VWWLIRKSAPATRDVAELDHHLHTAVMHAIEETIWATSNARAVRVRCAPDDVRFREASTAANHAICFPRAAMWIHRAGDRPFVADPAIAIIMQPGSTFTRSALNNDGERIDRFELSPPLARRIAMAIDPRADLASIWSRSSWAPVNNELYVRQRSLFRRLEWRVVYDADAEEEIIGIVSDVLAQASSSRPGDRQLARAYSTHCDIVEQAKSELNRSATIRVALTDLSRALGVSPFHLCRIFKSRTGQTLHQYQLTVRLRAALERLGEADIDLSRLAQELGFANHSHFTNAVRRRFGATPSALRQLLRTRQVGRAGSTDWIPAARSVHRMHEQAVESA
jgi:AraC-like DNA-binding protein